jgi:choline dehydrogenase-like flavoprotein
VTSISCDVLVIGSGAGGGTVAYELRDLPRQGQRVLVLEQGARLDDKEFTGQELEMAQALYADGGGFLTADRTMTLAFGQAYGGSTVVYTGTSLIAPERVIRGWNVPGLTHTEISTRSREYAEHNNVHLLDDQEINENNRLFVRGAAATGYHAEQFPLNLKGCLGSSLCNLGCPNAAKQGTHRVQLPLAERAGVEVVTRAEVLRLEERVAVVRVSRKEPGTKGRASEWPPGEYRVQARTIVLSGGAIGSTSLLLRSGLGKRLPRLGHAFTCHPALILVGEHAQRIRNDVGHPKSYFVDRGEAERFVLETCMYFPFVTAKNLTGFGPDHSAVMRAFPRLQMILLLACDRAVPQNRITVDRKGNPVVHYHFTDEVVAALAAGTKAAARIFRGAGAVRMHAPLADPRLLELNEQTPIDERIKAKHFLPGSTSISAAHLMGGCGMGTSVTDSVTDSWGRVHGLSWLRVADSALFPNALEINPYLTVMALAGRVADYLIQDFAQLDGATTGATV